MLQFIYDIVPFRAPRFHYKQKRQDWYWAVGIITITAAATAIIFSNILWNSHYYYRFYPHRARFLVFRQSTILKLMTLALLSETFIFTYGNLESFWIEHHENGRMLIRTKHLIMPHLVVPGFSV